ncbi:type II CAAX prenyl endopeptidase Rce1 family protein [Streptomyces phyllanthi]|uniref:CPBP family intramembrane glutamic endopeptidase n=1 Tax=Streptomyces phyllanthi TaxID=1803180 RepID=UPI0031E9843D
MTTAPLLDPLPYHRMARYTDRLAWWRPVLGTLLVGGGWFMTILVLGLVAYGVGDAAGYPELPDGSIDFGPTTNTALELATIAIALPLVLLAVRWTGRRPAGTVSSVTGRLRVRWLVWCLLAAVPAIALLMGALLFLPGQEPDPAAPAVWVGRRTFASAMAVLVVLVPFQAAAEEYVFRGWLTQAAGAFLRSPWIAALPQSLLFAAAHGWGTVWGFIDLAVFGLATGWLAVRTGGLEAGIALHVVNNLTAFGFAAAVVDGLSSDETSADAPWQQAVISITVTVIYTAMVLWLARRHRPVSLSPSLPLPAPWQSPAYGAPTGHGPSPYGVSHQYVARGPYDAPFPYGASHPYGAPFPYGAPPPYNAASPYDAPSPHSTPAPYGASHPYGAPPPPDGHISGANGHDSPAQPPPAEPGASDSRPH